MAKTAIEKLTPKQIKAASIKCAICGHEDLSLIDHISEEHGMTVEQYQADHKGRPVVSNLLLEIESATQPKVTRRAGKELEDLTVNFSGLELDVWHDVPAEVCLKVPPNYRLPKHGQLGKDIAQAVLYCAEGLPLWISGGPGLGKDAYVYAFSSILRRPATAISIAPGMDLEAYLYTRSFAPDENGNVQTFWEYGQLWKALTEGYVTENGDVRPYIVLLSDFDRATKAQVEVLRLILDSIEGRVMSPDGKAVPIVPGTQIIATANSQGQGDTTGRCISARAVDSSIMDRFDTAVLFHSMSWKDESEVLRNKFGKLFSKVPEALDTIGACTKALRSCINKGDLYMEFSHRTVCAWARVAEAQLKWRPNAKVDNLLKDAARAWLDKLGDEETRMEAKRVIDPYMKGGVISAADLEGDDELVEGF